MDRLAAQIPTIRERIKGILALAEELKGGTIESVLAKSDLELGLEVLKFSRVRSDPPPDFGTGCFNDHEARLAPGRTRSALDPVRGRE